MYVFNNYLFILIVIRAFRLKRNILMRPAHDFLIKSMTYKYQRSALIEINLANLININIAVYQIFNLYFRWFFSLKYVQNCFK